MTAFPDHPYACTLVYPHTASIDDADAYVKIKAPERGDRRIKGRNQTFSRLKNGNVVVYDMGTNMSDMLNLSFEQVPQKEYAALILFFEYVVWGANKVKYIDYKGDEYIVRVYKNTVDAVNRGESKFDDNDTTLYDFSLDLIDVTNNTADSGQTAMPTQLALHIADINHPHNPKVSATVADTDGTVTLETQLVDDFKHVTWLVVVNEADTYTQTVLVHATHDGTASLDATAVASTQDVVVSEGTDPADITITVTLISSGLTQAMALNIAKGTGTVNVVLRRIKV